MVDSEGKSESGTRPYWLGLAPEDLLWFLEDVVHAAKKSGFFSVGEPLAILEENLEVISALYDTDEEQYWRQIDGAGREKLLKLFEVFSASHADALGLMRTLYAPEVADRILHDRQLCSFIAETVMDIGFDGETVDGMCARWVEREDWPSRVKAILHARDRGKCAACGVDIVLELDAEGNIDHILPISKGGCNDLVNLQLLCSACNRKKLASLLDVANSVPQYIRRVPSIQD